MEGLAGKARLHDVCICLLTHCLRLSVAVTSNGSSSCVQHTLVEALDLLPQLLSSSQAIHALSKMRLAGSKMRLAGSDFIPVWFGREELHLHVCLWFATERENIFILAYYNALLVLYSIHIPFCPHIWPC